LLLRDVVERCQVSQVAALRWIARACLRNPAALLSAHALYRDLKSQGYAVSKDTVHALLGHLVDAFLLTLVPLATDSERRRNAKPRKVYPVDPGIIGAFDVSGRTNLGHALETAVLNTLACQGADVGYVKTDEGFEVDFLARIPGEPERLIQVCADPTPQEVLARELRALDSAARAYPRAERILIVLTHDQAAQIGVSGVRVCTAHKWLLGEEA
jgi:predicted AAA+ superfamily ATPase